MCAKAFSGTCPACNTTENPELTHDWLVYDDGVVTMVAGNACLFN